MRVEINVPDYSSERGLTYEWDDDYVIETKLERGTYVIRANTAGLVSFARALLSLADNRVPRGHHHHFDEIGVLEPGSVPMIIEKS